MTRRRNACYFYENIRQNAKGKRFAGTLWRIFE